MSGEGNYMLNKIPILQNYKEGSRTGNISITKGNNNRYNVFIDWDDPRYKSILLFSGKMKQCIDFSMNRFGLKKQTFQSLKL